MNHPKILVAGAGHGGLTAAILLSRKGFDVTVVEAQEENALGYDWRDCIDPRCFADAGLEPPPQTLEPMQRISYWNPRKSVCIRPPTAYSSGSYMIERKDLIAHLLSLAGDSGVRLLFAQRVCGARMQGTRVTGLLTEAGSLDGDLVIDAAGMDSPVRQSLPPECGIERGIRAEDTLFTFRALYANTGAPTDMPVYSAYFYHNGMRGFDWVVREPGMTDVLVGGFGSLSAQTVAAAVADFRQDHPYLGGQILRGGTYAAIPLRRTLPQFVCDGYAAIGDSASMIEPLSGSGMSLSIRAGAMLAHVVERATAFSKEELWPYVYAFFQKNMRHILRQDALKCAVLRMGKENMDAMFEKKIMTRYELYGGTRDTHTKLQQAAGVLTTPTLLPALAQMLRRTRRIDRMGALLPAQFDEARVRQWVQAYERF